MRNSPQYLYQFQPLFSNALSILGSNGMVSLQNSTSAEGIDVAAPLIRPGQLYDPELSIENYLVNIQYEVFGDFRKRH